MILLKEQFLDATLTEIKNGFSEKADCFTCLLCGEVFEKGRIYPHAANLYEAGRFVKLHIELEHGSVFDYLIAADKKTTGLSDHQNNLLKLFYQGATDAEIQRQLGIGSSSTIRNHRFAFREKERQAKLFLALMELLNEQSGKPALISPHRTATQIDDRYYTTDAEATKILKTYFPDGATGRLTTFSMKENAKLIVLRQLALRFASGRNYSEKEINELIKTAHPDYATIRRYLIEYGFLDRLADGSQYWLKQHDQQNETGENKSTMNRKKELTREYKETALEAGIYRIHNTVAKKNLVVTATDLKTINGKRFQLQMGGHMNKALQADWNSYGEAAFEFEVLERLPENRDPAFDKKAALKALETKWLEQLQPYDELGYNVRKVARVAK
ncbi:MAG: DUF2087 domain-containing protein [Bacillota bacterium]